MCGPRLSVIAGMNHRLYHLNINVCMASDGEMAVPASVCETFQGRERRSRSGVQTVATDERGDREGPLRGRRKGDETFQVQPVQLLLCRRCLPVTGRTGCSNE